MSEKLNIFKVFVDGGSRGNPGPSAIGVVIECDGVVILEHSEYIGEFTNNHTEYLALIRGLEKSVEFNGQGIHIFSDSELLCRQMTGVYVIKNENLRKLAVQAKQLEKKFKYVRYTQVGREQNQLADKLVNKALDERLKPAKTPKSFRKTSGSAGEESGLAPAKRVSKSISLNAKCSDCEGAISNTFKFCPHCGLSLKD